jgi:DNA-binding MarR family transcriptional regulator
MKATPSAGRNGSELLLLRHIASQPPQLRHVTVEWLAETLAVTEHEAVFLMESLAADGLATCHRDADDGCICCASPTELGLGVARSGDGARLRLV